MRTMIAAVLIVALASPGVDARVWTDRTGKYKTEAEFVSAKAGIVRLKKPDGTMVDVSLSRLSEGDQRFVHIAVASENKKKLAEGIRDVFKQGKGETTAKQLLLESESAERLCKQFNGKPLILRYPIIDVEISLKRGLYVTPSRDPGMYDLRLGKVDFPLSPNYGTYDFPLRLSRAEVLRITPKSVLVFSGTVQLEYSQYHPGSDFFDLSPPVRERKPGLEVGFRTPARWCLTLSLDKMVCRIENPVKPKKGGK